MSTLAAQLRTRPMSHGQWAPHMSRFAFIVPDAFRADEERLYESFTPEEQIEYGQTPDRCNHTACCKKTRHNQMKVAALILMMLGIVVLTTQGSDGRYIDKTIDLHSSHKSAPPPPTPSPPPAHKEKNEAPAVAPLSPAPPAWQPWPEHEEGEELRSVLALSVALDECGLESDGGVIL